MEIYTMSALNRAQIWSELTDKQKRVFNQYTMDRVTSELLTRAYRISSHWRLVGLNIDYAWELHKKGQLRRTALQCECGRALKFQYELESTDKNHTHLFLGSTHFAEHAGIPVNIALEIQRNVNEIQIYMDEILWRYNRGERFPEDRYGKFFDQELLDPESHFGEKMIRFREAGLPLFHVDQERLHSILRDAEAEEERLLRKERNRVKNEEMRLRKLAEDRARLAALQQFKTTVLLDFRHSLVTHVGDARPGTHLTEIPNIGTRTLRISQRIVKLDALKNSAATNEAAEELWIKLYHEMKMPRAHPELSALALRYLLLLEGVLWSPRFEDHQPSDEWRMAQLHRIQLLVDLTYPRRSHYGETQAHKQISILMNRLKTHPELWTKPNIRETVQGLYVKVMSPAKTIKLHAAVSQLNDLSERLSD